MHSEPTTLMLTVDPPQNGRINLSLPRKRTPDGAGILVWAPLAALALGVLVLVVRYAFKLYN